MDLYTIRERILKGENISSMKLKVTYYSRVSTNHLEQKKSLLNQNEHFDDYIKSNPNWRYVNGYVDDGISGTSDIKRDYFMKMIEDAKKGLFDLIVTKEISRFSRNTVDSIRYTRLLLSYGVAVIFINDNINTALPDSELRLTIMASMAQDEIRRLSERIKFGMNQAILRGDILGNDTLYGYHKNFNNGCLEIVKEEAKVIQLIFQMYAKLEYSLSYISKYLNKSKMDKGRKIKFDTTSISRIIKNPKYKGYYCGKKSEVVDYMNHKIRYYDTNNWIIFPSEKIPAIIPTSLFDEANIRLQKRSKRKRQENKSIFFNKLVCGVDGSIYSKRKFRKHNADITWICSKYLNTGKKNCNSANIRESELTKILYSLISKLDFNFQDIINFIINSYQKEDNILNKSTILKKINFIENKIDKILDYNIKGIISDKEYIKKREELLKESSILKNSLTTKKEDHRNLTDTVQSRVYSTSFYQRLIFYMIEKIVVYKKKDDEFKLDIFIQNIDNSNFSFIYEFKRGYDTKGTRRYSVLYEVNFLFR